MSFVRAGFWTLAFLGSFAASSWLAHAATYNPRNTADEYRWPIPYGQQWTVTQGQFNTGSAETDTHGTDRLLQHSLDLAYLVQSPVFAARDGVAHCEDWRQFGFAFGYVIRVVHGSDSDFYAHADLCLIPFGTQVSVTQGRQISQTGRTAVGYGDVGDHLHFMRTTTTTSTYSAQLSIEGISCSAPGNCFPHPGVVGQTILSDNLSAGYRMDWYNPGAWEPAIHDKAYGVGWAAVGSTAALPEQTPGRPPFYCGQIYECGWPPQPGYFDCNFSGSTLVHAGKIQTFAASQVPTNGQGAILKGLYSPAVFMSRGILGGYTDPVDGYGRDVLYYFGFPLADAVQVAPETYQMEFGFPETRKVTCSTIQRAIRSRRAWRNSIGKVHPIRRMLGSSGKRERTATVPVRGPWACRWDL
jgi:hypothetical protein